jgi:hypothetical protein
LLLNPFPIVERKSKSRYVKKKEKEMNAAIAVSTTQEAPNRGSLAQEIPLANISESKTNPRSQYDEAKLAELAANVKQHGVLQPVLVRPHPNGVPDTFELVVGSRRFRASKLARRETIPAPSGN